MHASLKTKPSVASKIIPKPSKQCKTSQHTKISIKQTPKRSIRTTPVVIQHDPIRSKMLSKRQTTIPAFSSHIALDHINSINPHVVSEANSVFTLFSQAYPVQSKILFGQPLRKFSTNITPPPPMTSTHIPSTPTKPVTAPITPPPPPPPPLPVPEQTTKVKSQQSPHNADNQTPPRAEPIDTDTTPITHQAGSDDNTTAATSTTTAAPNGQPQYAHFRRAVPKTKQTYTPTESYFDENGDECLVIYEVDQETIQFQLRERLRSLANALILGPAVMAASAYVLPSPQSYIMIFFAALFMIVNGGRVYGIHAFVTKMTAVWPQERSDISVKMRGNLNEALIGLTPLPGEDVDNNSYTEENEFEQRQKHNFTITQERRAQYEKKKALKKAQHGDGDDDVRDGDNNDNDNNNNKAATGEENVNSTQNAVNSVNNTVNNDTIHSNTDHNNTTPITQNDTPKTESQQEKIQVPIFPQPGVDPMGRVFSFNLNAPDPLTWRFGWSDMTRRAAKTDVQAGTFPLLERANFSEQVRAWSDLPDPDFPEYIYIDRLNDGKTPLFQKTPLSEIAAVWSVPIVPPALPQITPKLIDQLQPRPHDQMVIMVRASNTVTGLFPKFTKHDVAINQFIFGANLNARDECKGKFEGIRGRLKL